MPAIRGSGYEAVNQNHPPEDHTTYATSGPLDLPMMASPSRPSQSPSNNRYGSHSDASAMTPINSNNVEVATSKYEPTRESVSTSNNKPRKSAFWLQVQTLVNKNLTILLTRHFVSTLYAALLLPALMSVYLGIGQSLSGSGNNYGITPTDPGTTVRSLADGLGTASSAAGRKNVVFVDTTNGAQDVKNVINNLSQQITSAGGVPHTITDPLTELGRICTVSFQGTTPCYGAVVFNGSPDSGSDGDGVWNYTLRGDAALGNKFSVENNDNDPQVYILPLQRAVDTAIASTQGTNSQLPSNITDAMNSMKEWLFTAETEDERKAEANRTYQQTFINFMGVAILLAFFGISYHLPGYVSTERENGLAQLIDAMIFTAYPSEASTIRMISHLLSFTTVYFPGWVLGAIVLKFMIWKQTSLGIVLPYFILAGGASTSFALVAGTLFKKAQLSGVVGGLAYLLLGVLVQAIPDITTAGAIILGLLFPSCNMLLMIKYLSRSEASGSRADLLHPPPSSDHNVPAIAFWMCLIVQMVVYPFIAALLERSIHGAAADSRVVWTGPSSGSAQPRHAVTIENLTREFHPSIFRRLFTFISRPRPATVAVNNLNLSIPRGQIVSLLGANGSGKSTTLDAIAGLQSFSTGKITIDASNGVGVAPQKNVLWDELTVIEHVALFNKLKNPRNPASSDEITALLRAVGLIPKKTSKSSTLSGGQKRKLQLAMMLTGGSSVCLVDEVSSGIDPLSRRKIWDILLSERGKRTIILTTHFLDEADLLSDKIAIMSKGVVRAEGSAVELKENLGSGFRVHLSRPREHQNPPRVEGVEVKVKADSVVYMAATSDLAARVVRRLEADGIAYRLSSPTIEDVFLHTAEEYANEARVQEKGDSSSQSQPLELLSGHRMGIPKQTIVLLKKRVTLLKRNWVPYLIAFLIPVVAAAIMQIVVRGEQQATCTPVRSDQANSMTSDLSDLTDGNGIGILAGPTSSLNANSSTWLSSNGLSVNFTTDAISSVSGLLPALERSRTDIWPGGFWTGSPDSSPTVIYRADSPTAMTAAVIAQNLIDSTILAVRIAVGYTVFDTALGNVGKTLQLAIFFSVILAIAPAFLSLYPNLERRNGVRGLQYSSGVRVVSQWGSHIVFDFGVMLLPVIAAALIFNFAAGQVFWNGGFLVLIFLLYIAAAILLSYIISLLTGSQLATWAAVTATNGVGLAVYFISFIFIINLSDPTSAQKDILTAHFIVSIIFPLGSLMRAMIVSLNVFYQACDGPEFISNPAAMSAFGAPILYLIIQICLYFAVLLANDSRVKIAGIFSRSSNTGSKNKKSTAHLSAMERGDAPSSSFGLDVKRLTKSFNNTRAVQNISFTITPGEVFALLGPNGAGKSTTISMIRGDILPGDGDVFISQNSILSSRASARSHLGVCPQFDALDTMTTEEHLSHYARLRGISDIPRQVNAVIRAVGLEDYRHTMADHLSGGNKRKLSLGIALTGNPSVILLDEPSSGLDAAAKRIMWDTLKRIVPGRSILLTTHSMEEADTLAHRAGILARKMLAMDTVTGLERSFGDSLHVHLVSATAPHSTPEEMEGMRRRVLEILPHAKIEEGTYCGQMRLSVPAVSVPSYRPSPSNSSDNEGSALVRGEGASHGAESAIGNLLVMLEDNKGRFGVEHYSVAPTGLNDVFLAIVGEHQVKEEGYGDKEEDGRKGVNWRKALLGF